MRVDLPVRKSLRSRPALGSRPGLLRRGFTLVELMVVVAIVAILAAAATPSVIRLVQDRRSQKDALELLGVLQESHGRAFGRGGAVVVTFTARAGTSPPRINFQDSMQDLDGDATGDIPSPFCNGTPSGVISFWQSADRDQDTNITMNMMGQAGFPGGDLATQQLCFTPRGGTMGKVGTTWVRVTDAVRFSIVSNRTGNERFVFLYPNGMSRLRI